MPRFFLFCSLSTLFMGTGWGPAPADAKLTHGVIWYGGAPNDSVVQLAARRYSVGVTGKNESSDYQKDRIKQLNPQFRWYVYNSGTDNYVPPNTAGLAEHDLLNSICTARGWNPEIAYLHYYDDTKIVLEGQTLLIPGWGGGSATSPEQARIPVYYKNLTRRVANFSTPQSAQLYRQVMVQLAFDTPFLGTTLYPDGLFLDNSAGTLYNYGTIVSGGHVREATNRPVIGSPEFRSWHWNQNLGPYLTSLKDTLQTSASWAKDGKRKYLMINNSNFWDDSYVRRDVADVLFLEFEYNPVRSFGLKAVDEAYRRSVLAAGAGIACFYSATMTRTVTGHEGSYSQDEIMLGNLCWFLMTRTPSTIFYQQGTNTPNTPEWDNLTWIGAMDVADQNLGEAVAPPFLLAQGIDPLGNSYAVHARQYQGGLVVLRNRGDYDEGIELQTAVTIPLSASLQSVDPNGNVGGFVNQVTLRNGQGALFLNGTTPLPPPTPPPPPEEDLLTFTVTRDNKNAVIEWQLNLPVASDSVAAWPDSSIAGPDTVTSVTVGEAVVVGLDVYRQWGAETTQFKLNQNPISPNRKKFVDTQAPMDEATYWMVAHTQDGHVLWHGPATLPAAPLVSRFEQPGPTLSHPNPNPARAGQGILISFSVVKEGWVKLEVFDLAGRRVNTLHNASRSPGDHEVRWNGVDESGIPLAPGVYFYRLKSQDATMSRKLMLMR